MQIFSIQNHQQIVPTEHTSNDLNRSDTFNQNQGDIDKVNITSAYSNTNTTNSIINSIDQISQLESYQKTVNTQITALDKVHSTLRDNNASIDVANMFLDDITTNVQDLYEDLEDQFPKSYSYFDGIKGSLPMDFENIKKTTYEAQERLKDLDNSLQNKKTEVIHSVQSMIVKQKQQLNGDFTYSDTTSIKDDLTNLDGDFVQIQHNSTNGAKLLY